MVLYNDNLIPGVGVNVTLAQVDKNYDPQSDRAQSGKAVAAAIAAAGGGGVSGDFVEKVKGNGYTFQVYAAGNSDGEYNDITLTVEDNEQFEANFHYGKIPSRQPNGNIMTNAPIKDIDCTNKKYVDDACNDAIITALSAQSEVVSVRAHVLGQPFHGDPGDPTKGGCQKSDKNDWAVELKFTDVNPQCRNNYVGTYSRVNDIGVTALSSGSSVAKGKRSFAAGSSNLANADKSVAVGCDNIAAGNQSFVAGYANFVNGESAAAFGGKNVTLGGSAFAAGSACEAIGDNAIALSTGAIANGKYTFAAGNRVHARFDEQIVVGKFNKPEESNIFEVGNGADINNTNTAFAVLKDGNAIRIGNTILTEIHLNKLLALIK